MVWLEPSLAVMSRLYDQKQSSADSDPDPDPVPDLDPDTGAVGEAGTEVGEREQSCKTVIAACMPLLATEEKTLTEAAEGPSVRVTGVGSGQKGSEDAEGGHCRA